MSSNKAVPLQTLSLSSPVLKKCDVKVTRLTRYEMFHVLMTLEPLFKSHISVQIKDELLKNNKRAFSRGVYFERWYRELAEITCTLKTLPSKNEYNDKMLVEDYFSQRCCTLYMSVRSTVERCEGYLELCISMFMKEILKLKGFKKFTFKRKLYCTHIDIPQRKLNFTPFSISHWIAEKVVDYDTKALSEPRKNLEIAHGTCWKPHEIAKNKLSYEEKRVLMRKSIESFFEQDIMRKQRYVKAKDDVCNQVGRRRDYRFRCSKPQLQKCEGQVVRLDNLDLTQVLSLIFREEDKNPVRVINVYPETESVHSICIKQHEMFACNEGWDTNVLQQDRKLFQGGFLPYEINSTLEEIPRFRLCYPNVRQEVRDIWDNHGGVNVALPLIMENLVDKNFSADVQLLDKLDLRSSKIFIAQSRAYFSKRNSPIRIRMINLDNEQEVYTTSILRKKGVGFKSQKYKEILNTSLYEGWASSIDSFKNKTNYWTESSEGVIQSVRKYIQRGKLW